MTITYWYSKVAINYGPRILMATDSNRLLVKNMLVFAFYLICFVAYAASATSHGFVYVTGFWVLVQFGPIVSYMLHLTRCSCSRGKGTRRQDAPVTIWKQLTISRDSFWDCKQRVCRHCEKGWRPMLQLLTETGDQLHPWLVQEVPAVASLVYGVHAVAIADIAKSLRAILSSISYGIWNSCPSPFTVLLF